MIEIDQAALTEAIKAATEVHEGPAPHGWNRAFYRSVYEAAIRAYHEKRNEQGFVEITMDRLHYLVDAEQRLDLVESFEEDKRFF